MFSYVCVRICVRVCLDVSGRVCMLRGGWLGVRAWEDGYDCICV